MWTSGIRFRKRLERYKSHTCDFSWKKSSIFLFFLFANDYDLTTVATTLLFEEEEKESFPSTFSLLPPYSSSFRSLHRIKLIKSNFCFQVPVAVPVDRPVAVPVPKPYPVEVTRHVAVPVERPVPVPIKVPVPAPYAIKVPQPYAVPYVKQIPLPVVQPAVVIEKYNHGGWPSGYSSW